MHHPLIKPALMELVGTCFLILVITVTGNALAIAIIISLMVYVGAHISGGQYNPALTLALLASGKMKRKEALAHIVAQVLGALLGFVFFYALGGKSFALQPSGSFTWLQAGLAEVLFTFSLTLTVFFTIVDTRVRGNSYFGFAVGASVLSAILVAGPISGAALNPVVGVIPQLLRVAGGNSFSGEAIVLYSIAPTLGALLAAVFYEFVATSHVKPKELPESVQTVE